MAERYFAQLPPPDDPYTEALMRVNDAGVAFRRGDAVRARELLAGLDDDDFASDDRAELAWRREQLA
jgi:hypothetical protein